MIIMILDLCSDQGTKKAVFFILLIVFFLYLFSGIVVLPLSYIQCDYLLFPVEPAKLGPPSQVCFMPITDLQLPLEA